MNKYKKDDKGHYQELVHGLDDAIRDYISNGIGSALADTSFAVKDFCEKYRSCVNENIVTNSIAAVLFSFTCETMNALTAKGVPISVDMMSHILMDVHNRFLFQSWKQFVGKENK